MPLDGGHGTPRRAAPETARRVRDTRRVDRFCVPETVPSLERTPCMGRTSWGSRTASGGAAADEVCEEG